jgi:hypothetical protein
MGTAGDAVPVRGTLHRRQQRDHQHPRRPSHAGSRRPWPKPSRPTAPRRPSTSSGPMISATVSGWSMSTSTGTDSEAQRRVVGRRRGRTRWCKETHDAIDINRVTWRLAVQRVRQHRRNEQSGAGLIGSPGPMVGKRRPPDEPGGRPRWFTPPRETSAGRSSASWAAFFRTGARLRSQGVCQCRSRTELRQGHIRCDLQTWFL